MAPPFVPLHVQSAWSLGHGTATADELAERAARLGLRSLALTDTENLYGQVAFHHAVRARGLRPITGCVFRGGGGGAPLIVLAKTRKGYESLCRAITVRRIGCDAAGLRKGPVMPGFAKRSAVMPGFAKRSAVMPDGSDALAALKGGEDLVVLAAEPGILERLVNAEIVPREDVRALVIRPGPARREAELREAARRHGISIAGASPILYLDPCDAELAELRLAIHETVMPGFAKRSAVMLGSAKRSAVMPGSAKHGDSVRGNYGLREALRGEALRGDGGLRGARPDLHFRSPAEMDGLFSDDPGALAETARIADVCELDLRGAVMIGSAMITGSAKRSAAMLEPGETAPAKLEALARAGLARRLGSHRRGEGYEERLRSELATIDRLGFSDYFLVVAGIVALARRRGMEAVGRGSAAGSLVTYALGITSVDPVENGLCFERFLHEGRAHLPDIDVDLPWDRRDELIEEVYREHGRDRVAMIACHDTFQPRSALRETLRALGCGDHLLREALRGNQLLHDAVEGEDRLRGDAGLREARRDVGLREGDAGLREALRGDEGLSRAVTLAERLVGLPRAVSVHPGGIVIADRPLDAYTPLEIASKGIVITQLDMRAIECMGLVKVGLLGNKCLSELDETLHLVRETATLDGREGEAITGLEGIPDGDPSTLRTLQDARTIGCFQIETPAMRALLGKLQVCGVSDLTAALALLRPGAAARDARETYIRNPSHAHPSLEDILPESHGVILYEEDIIRVASRIAGMSLDEADVLRSAVRNARDPRALARIQTGFIRDALARGIGEEPARAVWAEIEKFAAYSAYSAYSFSKAHASGYAVLAYQSAYLKTHHPLEFFCALLNHHGGMYARRTLAWEAMRTGVRVLPPSVNLSGAAFSVERKGGAGAIRTGLSGIKGVSRATVSGIIRSREERGPYTNLAEFLRRVRAPIRETEALLLSGGFDDLSAVDGSGNPLNRPQLLWELETRSGRGDGADASQRFSRSRNGAAAEPADILSLLSHGSGELIHPPLPDYSPMDRARIELRFLEMTLAEHPLRILRSLAAEEASRGRGGFRRDPILSAREAAERGRGRVRVAGLVAARRRAPSRQGPMEFITIEDETGILETVLFPPACESHARTITTAGPYVFEGEMLRERRSAHLDVRRVAPVLLGFAGRPYCWAPRGAPRYCWASRGASRAVPGTAPAVPGRASAGEREAAVMARAGAPRG